MKMLTMLAGAAALAITAPVMAQTPDAGSLAAARDLLKAADIPGQMKAMGPQLAQAGTAQMSQMFEGQKIPDELSVRLVEESRKFMASLDSVYTPQVIDEMAAVYARHFTVADLRWLTDQMQNPIMLRFRAETPRLMGELMPVLMKAMKPRQDAYMATIMQIAREWAEKHPNDKAAKKSPNAS